MMKKGETPDGKNKMNTRPKPEKEEVMKATKTLKALAMVCAAVICLNGYAAAEENALDAHVGGETVLTAIAAYVVAPWGAAATALTVFTGVGLVADVVMPERNEGPDTTRVMEQVAYEDQDNREEIELAAKDQD